jgi:hypothetical protein
LQKTRNEIIGRLNKSQNLNRGGHKGQEMDTNLSGTTESSYYTVTLFALPLWIWLPVLLVGVAFFGALIYKHFKKKNSN